MATDHADEGAMIEANPTNLQAVLSAAPSNSVVALRGGNYAGTYTLKTPGVQIQPYEDEPAVFVGPTKPDNTKLAWLRIAPTAIGAQVLRLTFAREGSITKAKAYNDFGIVTEADGVVIHSCRLYGMTKGVHIKGKCVAPTVVHCDIGPTYQSCVVISTSYGIIRGGLVGWCNLHDSYGEDAVQFMQNFDAADPTTDISNIGMILYANQITDSSENAFDLKGAGMVVIDGNVITRTAGSNDGQIAGWNHNSNATIMRGKNASAGLAIIRNNDLQNNCSGIRLHSGWKVFHNLIADNNYDPTGATWAGYGISQVGGTQGSACKNNLVYGHGGIDVALMQSIHNLCNPTTPGPGVPLTYTSGDGAGDIVSLIDAGYFTDWFGRKDLPPDVLWLGGERYEVQAVDTVANTVQLDRPVQWVDATPVYWRSPAPQVGPQDEWRPAANEMVRIVLESEMTPMEAAALRAAVADKQFTVRLD